MIVHPGTPVTRLLRARIPGAELVMSADDTHLDVIDGHWPEVLAGLLRDLE